VHVVEIGEHIRDWHKWCDCDLFDHVGLGEHFGQTQDLWVDDCGLLREPPYPLWKWADYQHPLPGYGLINASIGPDTIATIMPPEYAQKQILWEPWEHRLDPKDYFEQLSRIYMMGSGKSQIHGGILETDD
jgi:hypothetical protein